MSGRAKVLVVDDELANRMVLEGMMRAAGHDPLCAPDGIVGLEMAAQEDPDVILLDIMMPGLDGFRVLERLRADPRHRDTPVVVISALDDMDSIVRCIRGGADDYLAKPFNATLLNARVSACIERKRLRDQEADYFRLVKEYSQRLEARVRQQVDEITRAHEAMIFAMSKLAESRDDDTGVHLERVREYCRILARALAASQGSLGIDDTFMRHLGSAVPLHDIGKVGIPDRVLLKPGRLEPDEFDVMRLHTVIGADMLQIVDAEHPGNIFVQMGIEIARWHHERWDGAGYPDRLAGDDIPLPARLLALGDVYDALTTRRCYKEPLSHDRSREIIADGSGAQFDPAVVDAFIACEQEFIRTRERYEDTEEPLIVRLG